MKTMIKCSVVLMAILVMSGAVSAGIVQGQTLNLNFTNGWFPGTAGDAASMGNWNYYSSFNTGYNATTDNTTDMVDNAGSAVTGVSLSSTGWGGGDWNGGTAWPSESGSDGDNIWWDQYVNFWWAWESSTEEITIHGLDTNLTYNVRIYALNPRDIGEGTTTEITLNGSTINGGSQGDRWNSAATPFNWSDISTTGAGELSLSWNAYDPDNPVLNAMVIEAVPEPGTMAILGCGAMALIRRRNK